MKGVHWINLGQWPPALAVIADKKAYKRFVRKKCGSGADVQSFPPPDGGCCQKWVDGAKCLFVITVGEPSTRDELACTIAHEAAHATRWLFEHVGEKEVGQEAEAYLVEHILRESLKVIT